MRLCVPPAILSESPCLLGIEAILSLKLLFEALYALLGKNKFDAAYTHIFLYSFSLQEIYQCKMHPFQKALFGRSKAIGMIELMSGTVTPALGINKNILFLPAQKEHSPLQLCNPILYK